MLHAARHSTWLEIDLEAIRHNTSRLRDECGTEVMAVVKAGAYGHGGAMAARAALRGGAAWLGAARVEEGLELRRQGIVAPLLILGFTPPERLAEALEARLSLTVWRIDHLEAASAAASASGRTAAVHLKVDTGMNRIGAPPAEALALASRIRHLPALVGQGVYTHFARADETDRTPTQKQQATFSEVVHSLDAAGLRPEWIHAANTAGALAYPEARWDLVRSGVGIYGMHPSPAVPLPEGFEPALQWKSTLTEVKTVAAGSGVSYGHAYVTRRDERIGTVAVGYADGFRRVDGNFVLVGGKRVPIVGRVCMDQCLVQLDAAPEARPGDEVVLLGAQGDERIGAEEVARRWGTINYEVTCGITERVARVYR
ncbi:MAG TPA: alanine racemase [Anaerolineales bacterium]|nr:alanine racemase [Anaerolineales bacterium]